MLPSLLVMGFVTHTAPEENYLDNWFAQMSDSRHECPVVPVTDEVLEHSTPIFKIAGDCSEVDARWDYSFVSKIKVKNGVFEGKGRLAMPKRVKRDFR